MTRMTFIGLVLGCAVLAHGAEIPARTIVRGSELRAMVEQNVRALLAPGDVDVQFMHVPESLTIEGRVTGWRIDAGSPETLRGPRTVIVEASADGRTVGRIAVGVRVRTFDTVAVTVRQLDRHVTPEMTDVRWERRETTLSRASAIRRNQDLRELRTIRIVNPGTVLSTGTVEIAPLIEAGSTVRVRAAAGNVMLSMAGTAQQDGYAGEIIRVRMNEHGTQIRARVEQDGTLTVPVP